MASRLDSGFDAKVLVDFERFVSDENSEDSFDEDFKHSFTYDDCEGGKNKCNVSRSALFDETIKDCKFSALSWQSKSVPKLKSKGSKDFGMSGVNVPALKTSQSNKNSIKNVFSEEMKNDKPVLQLTKTQSDRECGIHSKDRKDRKETKLNNLTSQSMNHDYSRKVLASINSSKYNNHNENNSNFNNGSKKNHIIENQVSNCLDLATEMKHESDDNSTELNNNNNNNNNNTNNNNVTDNNNDVASIASPIDMRVGNRSLENCQFLQNNNNNNNSNNSDKSDKAPKKLEMDLMKTKSISPDGHDIAMVTSPISYAYDNSNNTGTPIIQMHLYSETHTDTETQIPPTKRFPKSIPIGSSSDIMIITDENEEIPVSPKYKDKTSFEKNEKSNIDKMETHTHAHTASLPKGKISLSTKNERQIHRASFSMTPNLSNNHRFRASIDATHGMFNRFISKSHRSSTVHRLETFYSEGIVNRQNNNENNIINTAVSEYDDDKFNDNKNNNNNNNNENEYYNINNEDTGFEARLDCGDMYHTTDNEAYETDCNNNNNNNNDNIISNIRDNHHSSNVLRKRHSGSNNNDKCNGGNVEKTEKEMLLDEASDIVSKFDVFDLSNGIKLKGKVYRKNFRPILYVFISILSLIPSMAINNWIWSRIVVYIHFSIALIGTLIDLFVKFRFERQVSLIYEMNITSKNDEITIDKMRQETEKGKIRNDLRKDRKGSELYIIDHNFFDYILNVDNIAVLVPSPYGYSLVWGFCVTSMILSMATRNTLREHDMTWIETCIGDKYGNDSPHIENGACLLRHTCFSILLSYTAYITGTSLLLLNTLKNESIYRVWKSKDFLTKRFPQSEKKMKKLTDAVASHVRYIIDYEYTLKLCMNYVIKIPYLAIILIVFCITASSGLLIVEANYFTQNNNRDSKIVYVFSIPFTSLALFGSLSALWRIYNLYKTSLVIIRELGRKLKVTSKNDIIEWVEIRKHYMLYRLPMRYYYGSFGITFVVFGTCVCVAFTVYYVIVENEGIRYIYKQSSGFLSIISTIVLTFAMLKTISVAVAISSAQNYHKMMLYAEKVRLEYFRSKWNDIVNYKYHNYYINNNNSSNNNKSDQMALTFMKYNTFEDCSHLIETVIKWLEFSDRPPKIAGIRMSAQVLVGFITYVVAAAMSIMIKIAWDNDL